MFDPFITAVNTERATLNWYGALVENTSNLYTPGYRERNILFSDYLTGTQANATSYNSYQGKAIPGRLPSNLFIEGKGWFAVRKPDGKTLFTRLGDFKLDGNGTFVNELGYKLQGFLTDDKGNIISGPTSAANSNGSPNNPSQQNGGTGFMATQDINLWLDPSNGKFFGKFEEYKIKPDGTVMGVANEGKTLTPLYKVAVANFINPNQLAEVEDYYFTPTPLSGQPVEGSGEIRSGLLEQSNTSLRQNLNYISFTKLQFDIVNKLVGQNKQLLQESVRLLQ